MNGVNLLLFRTLNNNNYSVNAYMTHNSHRTDNNQLSVTPFDKHRQENTFPLQLHYARDTIATLRLPAKEISIFIHK